MAKSANLTRISLIFLRPKPMSSVATKLSLFLPSKFNPLTKPLSMKPSSQSYSTTATPYPLQYEMIISRPAQSQRSPTRRRLPHQLTKSKPIDSPESEPDSELGFDDWIDKKLTSSSSSSLGVETNQPMLNNQEMDKSKRKYYNKRRKRMYGSDSEDDNNRLNDDNFVELKPEVVELRTLHKKEEELYFYDTFAYPWEKEKHYKMVYQLEKKYFPDQCFDKAFLEAGESNENANKAKKGVGKSGVKKGKVGDGGKEDKGLVFFEEEMEGKGEKDMKMDVSEKKVEEFFKCLKKVPNKDSGVDSAEPYIATRSTGLPPKWDSSTGTVVLVNKPKGE